MEWGFIILLVLIVPIVIVWPLLIWCCAIKGLFCCIRDRKRKKAPAQSHQTTSTT